MIDYTTIITFASLLFDLTLIFVKHISIYYSLILSGIITGIVYYMKTVLKL